MKSFILISFQTPPYKGVGATRWKKLSKHIAQKNCKVHILTVDWGQGEIEDIDRENIIIHRLKSGYPHRLRLWKPRSKILNFLKNLPFRIFLDRLFFFDGPAQNWDRYLIPYAKNLIEKEKIKTVIATGGPFYCNYLAALLKKEIPQISLIQDFRDLWLEDPYKKYTPKQYELVKSWKKFSITQADHIVCVSKTLHSYYLPEVQNAKRHVISNGYDPENFENLTKEPDFPAEITLTHIGSITNGREVPLFQLLDQIRKEGLEIKVIQIGNIGSKVYLEIMSKFSELINKKLFLLPQMSQKDAFKKLRESSYALLLNSPKLDYALSTKIYEYINLEVPTFSMNYGGEIHEFLKENSYGVSVNLNECGIDQLSALLKKELTLNFSNKNKYSHAYLAEQYLQIIAP